MISYRINPKRFLISLWIISAALCLASLILNSIRIEVSNGLFGGRNTTMGKLIYHNLGPLFSVNSELSIPTFFNITLYLISSAILFIIAALTFEDIAASKTSDKRGWRILSILFLALGFDEYASVHEIKIPLLIKTIGSLHPNLAFLRGFPWYYYFIPICFAILLPTLPLLKHLSRRTLFLFIISGAIFISGAVGIEILGINIMMADEQYSVNYGFQLLSTLEEFLEMAGLSLFIYAILDYLIEIQPAANRYSRESKKLKLQIFATGGEAESRHQ